MVLHQKSSRVKKKRQKNTILLGIWTGMRFFIGTKKWQKMENVTRFFPKNVCFLGLWVSILLGIWTGKGFFKNFQFLIKNEQILLKNGQKGVLRHQIFSFLAFFSIFPGGTPGNRENAKIWSRIPFQKSPKLSKVYKKPPFFGPAGSFWPKMVKNDEKWPKMVKNGVATPDFPIQVIGKWPKMSPASSDSKLHA